MGRKNRNIYVHSAPMWKILAQPFMSGDSIEHVPACFRMAQVALTVWLAAPDWVAVHLLNFTCHHGDICHRYIPNMT